MSAIELLESKHQELERLFGQIDKPQRAGKYGGIKRIVAHLLTVDDASFDAKIKVLKELTVAGRLGSLG